MMVKSPKIKNPQRPANSKQPTRVTAGAYEWLMQFGKNLETNAGVSVPCGDCNACCRAGYAVRTNDGNLYLPKPDGSCSELHCGRCSVYDHRPRTCQYYDCRTHFFSGIDPEKPSISATLKDWRPRTSSDQDRAVIAIIEAVANALTDQKLAPEDIAVQACLIAYRRIVEIESANKPPAIESDNC